MSLSMRDVDQQTGKDLNPRKEDNRGGDGSSWSNPSGPTTAAKKSVTNLPPTALEEGPSRPIKRLSSPERWEAKQLIAAGVLDVRDYPNFDDEHGLLNVEENEEELEIELNEEVFVYFVLF
jgi:ATP-dependent RNA helicase DHX8/PRP22